mgnify:FL=1
MKKRLVSLLLTLILCLSMMPTTAWAESSETAQNANGSVTYIDTQFHVKEKTCTDYTEITSESKALTAGWYVVTGEVTINGDVTVTGQTSIILRDGANLTINGGITLKPDDNKNKGLDLYGQKGQTGRMSITNDQGYALKLDEESGAVIFCVYGGKLRASGKPYAISARSENNIDVAILKSSGWKGVASDGTIYEGFFDFYNKPSFTVEQCTAHVWKYDCYDEDLNNHEKICTLCSLGGGREKHSTSTWTSNGESGHTGYCICGKEMETEVHDLVISANADGLTHSRKCRKCDYYEEATEKHDFTGSKTYPSGAAYIVCKTCGTLLAAAYDEVQYAFLQSAIDAAKESGGTVTLQQEVAEHVDVADGTVIIDMNGQSWGGNFSDDQNARIPLTVTGGEVTLKNGNLYQNGSTSDARAGVVVNGGSLIVGEDVSIRGGQAGPNKIYHSIDLQSGSLTLSEGTALLTGLKVPEGKTLADYLPTGTTFVKCTDEDEVKIPAADQYEYVTEAYITNASTESMAVVAHEHSCKAESEYKCDCGFTCSHKTFADGRCTICGYACPHEASEVTENNGIYTCKTCNTQMVVKVTKAGVVTYSTDFTSAMNEAVDGITITLLKDVDHSRKYSGITGDNTTVTLDLAGHTINDGWILVGSDQDNKVHTASRLNIIGSGSFITNGNLNVDKKATLDLSEWGGGEDDNISRVDLSKNGNEQPNPESTLIVGQNTGTIGSLRLYNWPSPGVKSKLKGGTYGSVVITTNYSEGEPFSSMLETGYAFQYIDTGEFVEYTKKSDDMAIYNVKVVKCPHGGTATDMDGGYKCAYCNSVVNVKVSKEGPDKYYATLADAIANAEDGDTVTPLDEAAVDSENYEIKHAVTLDLNGFNIKNITCLVEGVKIQDNGENKATIGTLTLSSGWLKDLLPEGYGFQKTDDTWASEGELNGTTISNVSVKQAPIESLRLTVKNETTVYGYDTANTPGITAAVVSRSENTGAEKVTYQWYQIKGSGAEAIKDATTDTYQLNTGLDAGAYTFYCIATANGYAVASKNVTVTVEKAEADGTAPQAEENLSYTGNAQDLIKAGSTSDGVMKYSLTQDGTYTDDIPTGTDAGTYAVWYKIIGDKNHKDSEPASVKVTIAPMKLFGVVNPAADSVNRVYDKTDKAKLTAVTFLKENGKDTIDIAAGDYKISNVHFNDANAGNDKQLIFTVALQSKNFVFADEAAEAVTEKTFECAKDSGDKAYEIAKAEAPSDLVNAEILQKYTITEGSASVAGAGMPQDAGTLSYAKQSDDAIEKVANWEVDAKTGEVVYTLSGGASKDIIKLPVTIRSTNYEDAVVDIVITLTEKDVPTVTVQDLTVTYDGSPVSAEKIQGTATFGGKSVAGTWTWKDNTAITNVADSGEKTVVFKPQDTVNYAEVEKDICLTIHKATPTGTPKYIAITADKKKLSDAGLTTEGSLLSTKGTVKWVDNSGKELSEETNVVCGETYKWEFTPTDADNYNKLEGTSILWTKLIESLSLTTENATVVYGYDAANTPVITAAVVSRSENTGAEKVTYQWYQIKGSGAEAIKDATTDTYQLNTGLDAGAYTFYCIATANGYAVASKNVTVTVEKAEADGTAPQAEENLSYTGNAQDLIKAGSTSDGVMKYSLTQDGTYTDDIPTGTDAGTYAVWYKIIGDKNHKDSEPASVKVTIAPMKLFGVVNPAADSVNRVYDKTDKAKLTAVTFLKENGKDTIDIAAGDYKISNVHFNDANAGNDKQLIFTVALQSKNYVFANEAAETVTEKTFECVKDSKGAAYEITKAAVPAATTTTEEPVKDIVKKTKLTKKQKLAQVKKLMKTAKFEAKTAKVDKKYVKVRITAKSSKTLISDIKRMGYTVKYKFYRSTKKTSGYKLLKTRSVNTFTDKKATKWTKYYYKAQVLVYDGKKLVKKSRLKQCSYGVKTWNN